MSQDKYSKRVRRRIRRAYFISTVSIALVLFLLGAVGYFMINVRNASDRMRENVSMSVILDENLENETVQAIRQKISAVTGVLSVEFISKERATADFKAFLGNDYEPFLEENPIPASLEVKFAAESSDPQSIATAENAFKLISGVRDVLYQKAIVEQIVHNLRSFNLVMVIFGIVLFVMSIILIYNTIRLSVASKRFLINTMKLVGATRWFIRRPFLGRALWQSLLAWFMATVLLAAMIYGLHRGVPEIGLELLSRELLELVAAMWTVGTAVTVTVTSLSVSRMIRLNSKNLFID